ncbi:MAG: DUF2256 domain-containing protein [Polyangiaceae bacterium]|nr:DUF2256 domain-containing protein [Polyangiaceae bacterium]
MHAKLKLPSKVCPVCERPFQWRKKWRNSWNDVKYCSVACRGRAPSKSLGKQRPQGSLREADARNDRR